MKELSLNILDIAENSVKARAKLIGITLEETESTLLLTITDNGCGMDRETLAKVTDPFFTTRTTRPVGMGLSLLGLAAEQTGGWLRVQSVSEKDDPHNHGTKVEAMFHTQHIDFAPVGDVVATLITLIQGSPDIDFSYRHSTPTGSAELETAQLREVLGSDISLAEFEVLQWIEGNLREQYAALRGADEITDQ
ncbi:MAG: ATP-binding protein [Ruminococcaceae bacterium]|nr:ATP-binding protein [Oscillospiraceae bacterium]